MGSETMPFTTAKAFGMMKTLKAVVFWVLVDVRFDLGRTINATF
jgi:hypothetical protein